MNVGTFSGIGRPERFFTALKDVGISLLEKLALGDHVSYSQQTLARINTSAVGADMLLTTEKYAVKLTEENFNLPCFSVGLDVYLDERRTLYDRVDLLLNKDNAMPLSAVLLEILACPKCKAQVALQSVADAETIACKTFRLAYPVREGVPVMLTDEARTLSDLCR